MIRFDEVVVVGLGGIDLLISGVGGWEGRGPVSDSCSLYSRIYIHIALYIMHLKKSFLRGPVYNLSLALYNFHPYYLSIPIHPSLQVYSLRLPYLSFRIFSSASILSVQYLFLPNSTLFPSIPHRTLLPWSPKSQQWSLLTHTGPTMTTRTNT